MDVLINETAKELGVAMNELQTTFDGQLNWKYYRKVEMLGKMLDDLIQLDKEINCLIK